MSSDRASAILSRWQPSHPGVGTYMECVSRSYLRGLATFSISFAGCHALQRFTAARLPYTVHGQLLVSALVASALAYKVTAESTRHCQNAWMATEDKHTFFNPIEERANKQTNDNQ